MHCFNHNWLVCISVLLEVFLENGESMFMCSFAEKHFCFQHQVLCVWVSAHWNNSGPSVGSQGDVMMMSWCMPLGRMCLKWLIAALLCTPSPETSTALSTDKHITNAVKTWHWKASGSFGVFLTTVLLETLSVGELQLAQGGVKTPLCHQPLLLRFILHNQNEITAWWYMAKWSGWCGWYRLW